MLLDKDEFVFHANQGWSESSTKQRKTTHWKCRERGISKCPARASTKGIYVKNWRNEHNHLKRPIFLKEEDFISKKDWKK